MIIAKIPVTKLTKINPILINRLRFSFCLFSFASFCSCLIIACRRFTFSTFLFLAVTLVGKIVRILIPVLPARSLAVTTMRPFSGSTLVTFSSGPCDHACRSFTGPGKIMLALTFSNLVFQPLPIIIKLSSATSR